MPYFFFFLQPLSVHTFSLQLEYSFSFLLQVSTVICVPSQTVFYINSLSSPFGRFFFSFLPWTPLGLMVMLLIVCNTLLVCYLWKQDWVLKVGPLFNSVSRVLHQKSLSVLATWKHSHFPKPPTQSSLFGNPDLGVESRLPVLDATVSLSDLIDSQHQRDSPLYIIDT